MDHPLYYSVIQKQTLISNTVIYLYDNLICLVITVFQRTHQILLLLSELAIYLKIKFKQFLVTGIVSIVSAGGHTIIPYLRKNKIKPFQRSENDFTGKAYIMRRRMVGY